MKFISYCWATLSCVLLLSKSALGFELTLGGYTKSFFNFQNPPNPIAGASPESSFGISERLRLRLFGKNKDSLAFEVAYDFAPNLQRANLVSGNTDNFSSGNEIPYRVGDIGRKLYPEGPLNPRRSDFVIFHNLDRVNVTYSLESIDFKVGRQAIAFGSARAVNPTDILAPFNYNTLDVEERTGIDTIRSTISLGELTEIDMGYVAGDAFRWDKSAVFLKAQTNFWLSDLAILYIYFLKNHLAGLDLQRAIFFDAGFWLEAAQVWASDGEDYLRLSTGIDYQFANGPYLYLEYHFNEAGNSQAAQYLGALSGIAYQQGGVFLLGRHYLSPGIRWELSPLSSLSGSIFSNLNDGSFVVTPKFQYSLGDNTFVDFGVFLNFGKSPILIQNSTQLRSEFGSFSDYYFTSFRHYF